MPVGSVNGVVSMPGSPNIWHSHHTRAPAVCAATAQIGQSFTSTTSARSSSDIAREPVDDPPLVARPLGRKPARSIRS